MSWSANGESDVAGYKIYWGKESGIIYQNVVDVGNVTTHGLSGLNGTFYFTVTAYDTAYSSSNDIPATIVNENQTNGHESWYSEEVSLKVGSSLELSATSHDFGNRTIMSSPFPYEFTITNIGNEDLVVGNLSLGGDSSSSFLLASDNASGATLTPGASARFTINFLPSAPGLKEGFVALSSSDGDTPLSKILLTGVGDRPGSFGELVWNAGANGGLGKPAIGRDGTIIVGSEETYPGTTNRKLYAFNPDGSVKWTFPVEGDAYNCTPAIGDDGTIYMGSVYGKKFYAINSDGTEKWNYQAPSWLADDGYTWSPAAVAQDGTIYFGSREQGLSNDWENGKLYALNPDGTLKWATAIGTGSTAPAIGRDGTIYIGTGGGKVYALNSDGSVKWIFTPYLPHWVESAPALGFDGTIYIGSLNYGGNNIYALAPEGYLKWKFSTGGTIDGSPAIGPEGKIYVGSDDDKLYALLPDGTLAWAFETGGDVDTTPVIGDYGLIYFGSKDGNFYALNPHGTQKWSFPTGSQAIKSSVMGKDGELYVSAYSLIAFSNNSKGLSESAWPMFGHDMYHTGRAGMQPFVDLDGDDDEDGIADAWEILHFGDTITAHATSDWDKDGYTDLQEFLNSVALETDPLGNDYDPKVENAPWGTGYVKQSNILWLTLPAILNNSQ